LNNYKGQPSYISTILDGIQKEGVVGEFEVIYAQGAPPGSTGAAMPAPNATLIAEAVAAIEGADIVLLALGLGNAVEGESRDRDYLGFPPPQAALLTAVQKAMATDEQAHPGKLVLAINSAGGVAFEPSGVDAVLQIWYGGQETGHGLADILWGRVNPSARLPLTIHPTEYLGSGIGPVPSLNMSFPSNSTSTGKQGRTYRYLADQESDAIFSFGWGLSYSQYEYSNLTATQDAVMVCVSNIGTAAGAEVAQLYLGLQGIPGSALPPVRYALKGFQKVNILSGSSVIVRFDLKPEQLTVVHPDGSRVPAQGTVMVTVSGHLPSDPRAKLVKNVRHVSNVVTANFTLAC